MLDARNASFSASAHLSTDTPPDVPKPASWAMMLGGFCTVGAVMRRGRRPSVRFV